MSKTRVSRSKVEEGSLATSAWMRVVSRYLIVSIRTAAYAASVHLLSVLDAAANQLIASGLVRNLVYLAYGVVLYEIAARIVQARYKPAFVCEGDPASEQPDVLVLNKTDYTYRVAAERLIYESLLYYGFSLAAALVARQILGLDTGWEQIGLGLLGAVFSVFNFAGVVIIAAHATSRSPLRFPAYMMAAACVMPLVAYVGYTFYRVFAG